MTDITPAPRASRHRGGTTERSLSSVVADKEAAGFERDSAIALVAVEHGYQSETILWALARSDQHLWEGTPHGAS